MLSRRELLLSVGAMGLPLAAAANNPGRIGVLQSRAPFIDENDMQGSRERAFDAYRVLLRRSLEEHGSLDWLVGGALPLSGVDSYYRIERLALTESSDETQWFGTFAQSHRLNLILGTWWSEPGSGVAPRLLMFDRDGRLQSQPLRADTAIAGVHVAWSNRRQTRHGTLAALCRQRRSFGVRVETLMGPLLPPGAVPPGSGGSCIVGPDGNVVASANPHAEACLVATA